MKIHPISFLFLPQNNNDNFVKNKDVSFGYSHKLKTLYKQGLLPDVKVGLYLKPLTKDTVSLEHIIPHSKGGPTVTRNLALADRFANSKRSNNDIRDFLTEDMIKIYLKQFENIKLKNFDGQKYIKGLIETFKKLGFKL